MQKEIEFHDSKLVAIAQDGISLCLTVDAYVHCWEKVAGMWKGTGWVQPVRICMVGANCTEPPELPEDLYGGEIRGNETTYDNMVPLPFVLSEPVTLRLELGSGEILEVGGQNIAIESIGPGRYVEELPDEFRPTKAG